MKNWLIALGLLGMGMLGCSRAPTLLVSVDGIPTMAQSLQVQTTNMNLEAITESTPYDLPMPAPNATSFLLQLENLSPGSVGVSVAAYSQAEGQGCILATGSGLDSMFMGPDDNLRVSLNAVTDTACAGKSPTLLSATPGLLSTDGGDKLVLAGWGFHPDSAVTLGTKATQAQYVSGAELDATTPAHAGFGPTAIKIVNKDGTSVTRNDLLRFYSRNPSFTGIPFQKSVSFNQDSGFVIGHFDPMTQVDAGLTFPTSNTVRILYTINAQVANQIDYTVGNYPGPMVAADFNNDGHPDIIVANEMDGTAQLLTNNGDGTMTVNPPFTVGTPTSDPAAMAAGDLNGDGLPDLVVANKNDNAIIVLINQGNGMMAIQSGQKPLTMGAQTPVSVAIGDINQDNLLDIAVAEQMPVSNNPSDYRVALYFNLGGGMFNDKSQNGIEPTVTGYGCTQPTSILFNDTNSDGIPDLAISCAGSNQVLVLLNMGKFDLKPVQLPTEAQPGRIGIADLNGDGFGDLVVPCAGPSMGSVDVFLNKLGAGFDNGQPYLSEPANCAGANQVALLDVMTNGHLDIAVGGTGCIGILLNQSM